MDEGFRIIAKLIVTENEKTRKSILKEFYYFGGSKIYEF